MTVTKTQTQRHLVPFGRELSKLFLKVFMRWGGSLMKNNARVSLQNGFAPLCALLP